MKSCFSFRRKWNNIRTIKISIALVLLLTAVGSAEHMELITNPYVISFDLDKNVTIDIKARTTLENLDGSVSTTNTIVISDAESASWAAIEIVNTTRTDNVVDIGRIQGLWAWASGVLKRLHMSSVKEFRILY